MSQKKYASLQTLQTFLTNLKNTFSELSHKHTVSDITDYVVDEELSATSTNPVQNKVIDAEFEAVATAMNALDAALDQNASSITNLSTLVGDTKVSEQIEAAQIVHVGPDMPTDPNIKVWINTSEEGTGVVPLLPIITSVSLPASGWTGSNPYSQTVDVPSASSTSMITLQPSAAQILALQDSEISMTVENDGNGVITFYAIGGIPSTNMTMQILITPVSYV